MRPKDRLVLAFYFKGSGRALEGFKELSATLEFRVQKVHSLFSMENLLLWGKIVSRRVV